MLPIGRCHPLAAAAAGVAVLVGCQVAPAGRAAAAIDCTTGRPVACYAPRLFRVAYGITPLLSRGIDGRGQTVVLPEIAPRSGAAGSSDIRKDLALFDRTFRLPTAQVQVITRLVGAASPNRASREEAGDAEMVHAVAPGAAIRIILLPPFTGAAQGTSSYTRALRLAPSLGGVVSVSAGLGEHCFTPAEVTAWNSALREDRARRVTVIASSGDFGAAIRPCAGQAAPAPRRGVDLPAADPLVLAVGGTSLHASRTTGTYHGETAWNMPLPPGLKLPKGREPPVASGGGFSDVFPRPAYQPDGTGNETGRGVPDVAADASPTTGMAAAFATGGRQIIGPQDGTSAGAPFWAAIIALADQYAGRHLGLVNPAIYRVARSGEYHRAFHDVTTGGNTVHYPAGTVTGYRTAPGWDPVTGLGSPDAHGLVPLLAA